jgi:hypothetical protein
MCDVSVKKIEICCLPFVGCDKVTSKLYPQLQDLLFQDPSKQNDYPLQSSLPFLQGFYCAPS